ncbi:Fatty acid hydroxylase superfamily protein [Catalinimonas alkaloidigena]|uniref:Fatty acid hydroxylase superfamily protein n=1 Tax=Catalinimonas alkaloidigena TaxID=1075417 RepID=A0A1G9HX27_9BACT|nr:sterol desaturase family protein [Catalinimonas alkaloidigena]SDL17499.1 Fatty acid hydroxylase superfamily protein [Catalinimonas alkaloidigena]
MKQDLYNSTTQRGPFMTFLRDFTKVNAPLVISVVFVIALALLVYSFLQISVLATLGLFLFGWLSFTLAEYLMHRYLYHIPTPTPRHEQVQFVLHGAHHVTPRDKERLALPLPLVLILSAVLVGLSWWLVGAYAFAWTAGFTLGYGLYLTVHYTVHTYRPPNNLFRYLWIHHSIHHYKDDERAFGVSSPLWDWVFGTMPLRDSVASSRKIQEV